MKNIKDIILILLAGLCFWLFIKPIKITTDISERKAEKFIKEKVIKIKEVETQIEYKWINNSKLETKINNLTLELETAKQARDTIEIIQIQDTTIYVLIQSNDTLKSIISLKDSINSDQSDIIELKDVIITEKDYKLKKARRRNIALSLVSVGLGVLLVK